MQRAEARTSVAQTLMARLPQLFQTGSLIPNIKHPVAADIIVFEIILGDFFLSCQIIYVVYTY